MGRRVAERDWHDWHAAYDNPGSGLARRLSWVQDRIRAALDAAPAGPVRAISLCAGQGRDLIGARDVSTAAQLRRHDPPHAAMLVARRLPMP